jgi:predicted DNA-binding transcriptional regulator YafY
MNLEKGMVIEFDYTNWKSELGTRKVFVYGVFWGSNEWHNEEQWLLHALDEEKGATRYFAMKDMKNVIKIR